MYHLVWILRRDLHHLAVLPHKEINSGKVTKDNQEIEFVVV